MVSPGDKIKIEKLNVDEKQKEVEFSEVLLLEKNFLTSSLQLRSGQAGQVQLEIGAPFIKGAKVIGKILKQDKAKKVIVFKYKAKKRYKVKKGHRQPYTEVEITSI